MAKKKAQQKASNGKGKKGVTEEVKKYVKSTIHKNIENKNSLFYVNGQKLYNITNDVASWRTNNIVYLTPHTVYGPLIIQGVTQEDRIGNKIAPRKCLLRMTFYQQDTNEIQPIDLNMYIFKPKGISSVADVRLLIENDFFQFGNNTLPLTGTLADNVLVPNSDLLTFYKRKTFKIGPAQNDTNIKYINNDYKLNQTVIMDVTKYVLKKYSFNDNSNEASENPTVLVFSPCPAGNILGGAGTNTCEMSINYEFMYEDA